MAHKRLYLSSIPPKKKRYQWIQHELVRFDYMRVSKVDKGINKRYLVKVSSYSRAQVTRLIKQYSSVAGEGAYVKYEMWLRRIESDRAGLVGLSGSFFAARREVCKHWGIYCPSDFNTALNRAKLGLVAITCPDVVGIYKDVKDDSLEYRRKMRTVIHGMTVIACKASLHDFLPQAQIKIATFYQRLSFSLKRKKV